MSDPEKEKARVRQWRSKNPERQKSNDRKRYLRDPEKRREETRKRRIENPYHHHRVTKDYVSALLKTQNGCCPICLKVLGDNFSIDHDKKCCPGLRSCGKCVRGLLHGSPCNAHIVAVADKFFRDPELFRRTMEYVKRSHK